MEVARCSVPDLEFTGRGRYSNTDISRRERCIGSIDTRTVYEISDIEGIGTRTRWCINIISEDDIVRTCREGIPYLIPEEDIVRRGENISCSMSEDTIIQSCRIKFDCLSSDRSIIRSCEILILTREPNSSIIISICYLCQYSSTN